MATKVVTKAKGKVVTERRGISWQRGRGRTGTSGMRGKGSPWMGGGESRG